MKTEAQRAAFKRRDLKRKERQRELKRLFAWAKNPNGLTLPLPKPPESV
jgi:hypothetical protein